MSLNMLIEFGEAFDYSAQISVVVTEVVSRALKSSTSPARRARRLPTNRSSFSASSRLQPKTPVGVGAVAGIGDEEFDPVPSSPAHRKARSHRRPTRLCQTSRPSATMLRTTLPSCPSASAATR